MKSVAYFLLLSIFIISCGDDDDNKENLALNFKLEYEDQPLVMFEEVTYPDGKPIEFTRFSFYLSEIQLTSDGTIFDAGETYIDLTESHSSEVLSNEGYTLILEDFTGDKVDELTFNLGLTPEQNSGTPQDYPSSSVLSKTGEYWSNWNSYVYVKIEGLYDRDGDGIKDGFALHLGDDDAMRAMSFTNLGDDREIELVIDVDKIFTTNGLYSIQETPNIHSLSQMDKIIQLMDNLSANITVN